MEQNLSLILDLGKSYLRLGYSGDDAPRVISESWLAYTSETAPAIIDQEMTGSPQIQTVDKYLSSDLLNDMNLGYVYESMWKSTSGSAINPRVADFFAKEMLPNRLSLESKIFPILMAEDNNVTRDERKSLLQVYLESGVTNNFMLMRQSLLAVYACGKINGAVVDSSSYTTSISTVEEGYFVQEGFAKIDFGGEHITEKLMENFGKNSTNLLPEKVRLEMGDLSLLDSSYFDLQRRNFSRTIKHALFSESCRF